MGEGGTGPIQGELHARAIPDQECKWRKNAACLRGDVRESPAKKKKSAEIVGGRHESRFIRRTGRGSFEEFWDPNPGEERRQ